MASVIRSWALNVWSQYLISNNWSQCPSASTKQLLVTFSLVLDKSKANYDEQSWHNWAIDHFVYFPSALAHPWRLYRLLVDSLSNRFKTVTCFIAKLWWRRLMYDRHSYSPRAVCPILCLHVQPFVCIFLKYEFIFRTGIRRAHYPQVALLPYAGNTLLFKELGKSFTWVFC